MHAEERTEGGVRVAHAAVRGRLRASVDGLRRTPELGAALERRVARVAGVLEVRARGVSGSVVVRFDPERVSIATLLEALEDVGSTARGERGERPTALGALAARLRARSLLDEPEVVSRDAERIAGKEAEEAPPWHAMAVGEVLERLEASCEGLSPEAVDSRVARFGPNALTIEKPRSDLAIFLGQLKSAPVLLLGGSALLSAFTSGVADALVIGLVVGANATLGWLTESSAERTLRELDRTGPSRAPVMRGGAAVTVAVEELVPGDVLRLSAGVLIPADARVVEAEALFADESTLTGESVPVEKRVAPTPDPRTPLGDRACMLYRGTVITGGRGRAVVVATGDATEVGRIRAMAAGVGSRETPMQRQLRELGTQLVWVGGAVCGGVLGLEILRGRPLQQALQSAVSLAVAAVPEGLPTIAITTLALGIRRMREHGVIVRRIGAVEALGSVQTLCLDKTGTLTCNAMTVERLHAGGREVKTERGLERALEDADLRALLEALALNNEVALDRDADGGVVLRGTPTEAALVQVALEAGTDVAALRAARPVRTIRGRTERRSTMATLHHVEGGRSLLVVKGRPSEVLAICTAQRVRGRDVALDDAAREALETANERLAGEAYRVLAVAMRETGGELEPEERELVHLGLVAMADPPREGLPPLMRRFHRAGIETVMITGDQASTAHSIAKRAGIGREGAIDILDSTRVDAMDPALLAALAPRVEVFARVSPRHKLAIVRALQEGGRVVAMTGDGVNDGPALRAADVGIAMGAGGSEAARELADVVLEHDRLESLVVAIESGRAIHDDVVKAVRFVLATNLSEILLTAAGVASGLGEPLTPMQLLWLNVLTDVLPELALAVEPPESDVLAREPRDPTAPMLDGAQLARIGIEGGLIGGTALAAFLWGRARWGAGPQASTMAFASLTSAQLIHAVASRSERHVIFDPERLQPNRAVPLTIVASLALQIAAERAPLMRRVLGTTPIGVLGWGVALGSGVLALLANEALKIRWRRQDDEHEEA